MPIDCQLSRPADLVIIRADSLLNPISGPHPARQEIVPPRVRLRKMIIDPGEADQGRAD